MIVCPWPAKIPMPKKNVNQDGMKELPSQLLGFSESATVQALLRRTTIMRFQRAYHHLRRSFARFGVPVLCAKSDDSVPLILNRLERLRILERGMA